MTGALEAGAKFSPAGIRALVSSKPIDLQLRGHRRRRETHALKLRSQLLRHRLLQSLAPHESILARAEPRPLPGGGVSFATCTSRQVEARRVGAESGGQRVMKPSSANPAIDPIPHHSMIRAESLRHDKVWSWEALQCPPVVPKLSGL